MTSLWSTHDRVYGLMCDRSATTSHEWSQQVVGRLHWGVQVNPQLVVQTCQEWLRLVREGWSPLNPQDWSWTFLSTFCPFFSCQQPIRCKLPGSRSSHDKNIELWMSCPRPVHHSRRGCWPAFSRLMCRPAHPVASGHVEVDVWLYGGCGEVAGGGPGSTCTPWSQGAWLVFGYTTGGCSIIVVRSSRKCRPESPFSHKNTLQYHLEEDF